jgi:hypothetical protein
MRRALRRIAAPAHERFVHAGANLDLESPQRVRYGPAPGGRGAVEITKPWISAAGNSRLSEAGSESGGKWPAIFPIWDLVDDATRRPPLCPLRSGSGRSIISAITAAHKPLGSLRWR